VNHSFEEEDYPQRRVEAERERCARIADESCATYERLTIASTDRSAANRWCALAAVGRGIAKRIRAGDGPPAGSKTEGI